MSDLVSRVISSLTCDGTGAIMSHDPVHQWKADPGRGAGEAGELVSLAVGLGWHVGAGTHRAGNRRR